VFILVRAHALEQKDYGNRCLHWSDNVQYVIPIFGLLTRRFFPSLGIDLLVKKAEKLT
jgi:hypothetical protein